MQEKKRFLQGVKCCWCLNTLMFVIVVCVLMVTACFFAKEMQQLFIANPLYQSAQKSPTPNVFIKVARTSFASSAYTHRSLNVKQMRLPFELRGPRRAGIDAESEERQFNSFGIFWQKPQNNPLNGPEVFTMACVLIFVCFIIAVVLVLYSYRRRIHARNDAMEGRLYQALTDSLDIAVNLYSPADHAITPIVEKTPRILGCGMIDFVGSVYMADTLDLSEEGRELLNRLKTGNVHRQIKGTFSFVRNQTQGLSWASYALTPLSYEGKQQILVVLKDATPEKEMQLSMRDAMTAAESANRAKSEFLSRMSHEIRTPMNAIIGMLQITRHHLRDPDRVAENLHKISIASNHLLTLINDVLDISKIESGKMALVNGSFRLGVLVKNVTDVIRLQCEQKGQELQVRVPERGSEILMGDVVRVRQMLINLLTNAVKYTPEGGHIHLAVDMGGEERDYCRVVFTVADDGIGMSQDFKNHLFEPFSMEGRSEEQGTGLGMPIVKNVVSMMGGEIRVETELGKGSTFTVILHFRRASVTEQQDLEESERMGAYWAATLQKAGEYRSKDAGTSAFRANPSPGKQSEPKLPHSCAGVLNKCRDLNSSHDSGLLDDVANNEVASSLLGACVLLVEDTDLNAEIACELLEEAGLVVQWARDGKQACEMFEASDWHYYDVVLMDVQMPRMDGYEATRYIRALDREDAESIPIIAMSANAFAEDVHASLESGMDAHLTKPIDMSRVLQTIVVHLRKRRAENRYKS